MNPALPTPHSHIVVTEFEGGESVLVDLETKRYYQLNETATLIWQKLSAGSSRIEIVDSLTSIYEVTAEDAEKSIDQVVEHLKTHRLLSE